MPNTHDTHQKQPKIGILLVNLGTPNSAKPRDVFNYLNEFLTDERVIDLPWLKRQLLVRGIIVPTRFRQSAQQYQHIWTKEGSPLLIHCKTIKNKLQKSLGKDYHISLAMRYQSPSILNGLNELKDANVEEILIFPLFPQYASATTGSVHQSVMETLSTWHVIPKITFINSFYDHPAFINAFCEVAKKHDLTNYDHILFSFHGLPEKHIKNADNHQFCLKENCCKKICPKNRFCYKAQCYSTAEAIAKQLGLPPSKYTVCFQSRLGKDPWIEPYTNEMIHQCSQNNIKKILVFSPAFICDCLETIYEIASEYKKEFLSQGGESLELVEGLNDHPKWIEALQNIILEHTSL